MKTYMHCTEPTAQDTLEHWTMMTRTLATYWQWDKDATP